MVEYIASVSSLALGLQTRPTSDFKLVLSVSFLDGFIAKDLVTALMLSLVMAKFTAFRSCRPTEKDKIIAA